MARIISILFPGGKTAITLGQIARIQAFDKGVGVFNLKGQMIAWVETLDETIAGLVVEMLDKVINSQGRIKPDWSMLSLDA